MQTKLTDAQRASNTTPCPKCNGTGHPPRQLGNCCPKCLGQGTYGKYFQVAGWLTYPLER